MSSSADEKPPPIPVPPPNTHTLRRSPLSPLRGSLTSTLQLVNNPGRKCHPRELPAHSLAPLGNRSWPSVPLRAPPSAPGAETRPHGALGSGCCSHLGSRQGCYPLSSLITLGCSLPKGETPIIWVIKHLFEFSPETAVIIYIYNHKADHAHEDFHPSSSKLAINKS